MNIALVFAGGIGRRMGLNSVPKQFIEVNGKPIIIYTLEHFEQHNNIDGIVISCVKEYISHLNVLIKKFTIKKVKKIICGGKTSQESIYLGLNEISKHFHSNSIILIHDAVRPLITSELISHNISTAIKYGNAISACSAVETASYLDDDNNIANIFPRKNSLTLKAPQTFILKDILNGHKAMSKFSETIIDSAMLMHLQGHVLNYVLSPTTNIKITMPEDLYFFKAFLDAKAFSFVEAQGCPDA